MNSIKASFKQKFFTGLVVTIPVFITIFVLIWAFRLVDGVLSPVLDYLVGYHIYGLGFITSIIIIFVIGVISTNVFGKQVIELVDRMLKRIPVFKGIYSALSQLTRAFSSNKKSSFKKFVIVEYPRKGTFAFGFLTKECALKNNPDGSECCVKAVYIPTNNLYLGEIVLFREEEVIYTDLSIEEGIKIILSGGIAIPNRFQGAHS